MEANFGKTFASSRADDIVPSVGICSEAASSPRTMMTFAVSHSSPRIQVRGRGGGRSRCQNPVMLNGLHFYGRTVILILEIAKLATSFVFDDGNRVGHNLPYV